MTKRMLFAHALLLLCGAALASAGEYQCQACTPGFFKNHPQFISGNSCASFNQDTPVSTLFPAVEACVGNLSLLQLLSSPTSVCGTGNTFAGAEVILLRHAITRIVNATNSENACTIASASLAKTNHTINDAIATDNIGELKNLAQTFAALNDDDPCSIGK